MPKSRHQEGRVEEVGKRVRKWRGHYFIYVVDANGKEQRKHRNVTLGPRSELKKWQAEQRLREIIAREAGEGTARPDSSVTFALFWKTKFLPLQTWRDSTRGVVEFVMDRHVLPRFGADSDDGDQPFRSYADQIGAKRRRALSV